MDGIHEQQRCSGDVLKQWENLVETQYAMLALVGPGRGWRTVKLKSMKTIGKTSLLAVQQIVQSARASSLAPRSKDRCLRIPGKPLKNLAKMTVFLCGMQCITTIAVLSNDQIADGGR